MWEYLNNNAEIIAILLSPLVAWVITILYQNRAEKRKAKRDLFLTLMAKRKTRPPPVEFIDAFNKIDVVFQENKSVRFAARAYLDSLTDEGILTGMSNSSLLDLLSEMANVLRYKNLRQTEIDRFYNPRYLANQTQNQDIFWDEYIRVLQYSKSLGDRFSKKEMRKRFPKQKKQKPE